MPRANIDSSQLERRDDLVLLSGPVIFNSPHGRLAISPVRTYFLPGFHRITSPYTSRNQRNIEETDTSQNTRFAPRKYLWTPTGKKGSVSDDKPPLRASLSIDLHLFSFHCSWKCWQKTVNGELVDGRADIIG